MALNDTLLTISRILSIILLVVFIATGWQGYLIIKHIRADVDTRLAAGQFPFSLDGFSIPQGLPIPGFSDMKGESLDLSSIGDASIREKISSFATALSNGDDAEASRQLAQLDTQLGRAGYTDAQLRVQQMKAALERGDTDSALSSLQELVTLLSQK